MDPTVTVAIIDGETVGKSAESDEPDSLTILRLCAAIRTFQDFGLNVFVVSKKNIRDELEETARSVNMEMGHFLCLKAYNAGWVDSIFLAVEYQAFYVTSADLSKLQDDWRFPMQDKAFLKANPQLRVDFNFRNRDFHPMFAPGVIPGLFKVWKEAEEKTNNMSKGPKNNQNQLNGAAKPESNGYTKDPGPSLSSPDALPSGWVTDDATPKLAVLALDCDGIRQAVVAILGVDDKDPLLQAAGGLCSGLNIAEVEAMKDWKYPIKTPWKFENGGGNLPHIVYLKDESLQSPWATWAIGISSRKKTRQRAAKLALFVARYTAMGSRGLSTSAELQAKILMLVERTNQLIPRAMAAMEGAVDVGQVEDPQRVTESPERNQVEESPERAHVTPEDGPKVSISASRWLDS